MNELASLSKSIDVSAQPATEVTHTRLYASVFLTVVFLLCLPLWLIRYIPLMDYPNHLARVYIIEHLNEMPAYFANYDLAIKPIPNVAIDLFVPVLQRVFDIETSGKIFLTLTVLIYCLGCHVFGKAVHGRATWMAPLCALLCFNLMFLTGFVNYIFGVGMFLIAQAYWLRYHQRWTFWRLAGISALFFFSYLSHLSAYSFLGFTCVIVCFCELPRTRRVTWSMALSLLPLVPPVLAFKLFMSKGGTVGTIVWSTVFDKIKDFAVLFRTYDHLFDGLLLIAMLAVAGWLLRRSRVAWKDRRMLAAGSFLVLLYLIFPKTLFTSWGTDIRFLPPAAMLIALSARLYMTPRVARTAFAMACLILLVRLGGIVEAWALVSPRIEAQIHLFGSIAPGARVFPIVFDDDNETRSRLFQRTIRHTIHYATIYRQSYAPSLFAIPSQQPLNFKVNPPSRGIEESVPQTEVNWSEIYSGYDYVWASRLPPSLKLVLLKRCERVAASGSDAVYRVRRESVAARR